MWLRKNKGFSLRLKMLIFSPSPIFSNIFYTKLTFINNLFYKCLIALYLSTCCTVSNNFVLQWCWRFIHWENSVGSDRKQSFSLTLIFPCDEMWAALFGEWTVGETGGFESSTEGSSVENFLPDASVVTKITTVLERFIAM